jgi:glycosyltransferase involved in cell wall biosynthesis
MKIQSITVRILAGAPDASLQARIIPLARSLNDLCFECDIVSPIDWRRIAKGKAARIMSTLSTHSPFKYIDTLVDSPDVLMIGRTSSPQLYAFERLMKRARAKIIFDMDDALFVPHRNLVGIKFRSYGALFLEHVVRKADSVSVNSHFLLGYARALNGNVEVINDPVDCDVFSPKPRKQKKKLIIGWEGSPYGHQDDLAILVKPLRRLVSEFDIKLKLVSSLGDKRVRQIFAEFDKNMEVDYGLNQWVPLHVFSELMSDFDIMVAPLEKTRGNEGKGSLRVGLGMAMGIPVVASEVGEQKYIVKHLTNGFLARNEEDWYLYLKTLVENDKMRETMGKNGRETAKTELSLEKVGGKLSRIIEDLVSPTEKSRTSH